MNSSLNLTHFYILKTLSKDPKSSQRELAKNLGVSLGKVNYCLKALIQKGWVKTKRFYNNPNKRVYAYLLTPEGIEAKARLAAHFLEQKMREYDRLRDEIQEISKEAGALHRHKPPKESNVDLTPLKTVHYPSL